MRLSLLLPLSISSLVACSQPTEEPTFPVENLELTTAQLAGFEIYTLKDQPNGILLASEAGLVKAEIKSTDSTLQITWTLTLNEETHYYSSFYTKEDRWISAFIEERIPGRIIKVMDLDQDGNLELLVDDREEDSAGGKGEYFLYLIDSEGQLQAFEPFEAWDFNLMVGCCNSMEFTVREVEGQHFLEVKEYLSERDELGMIVEDVEYRHYQLENHELKQITSPFLIIATERAPMYASPNTTEMITTVPKGSTPKVISRGDFDALGNAYDYWYEVQYNGQQGWLFGANTTQKHQGPIPTHTRSGMEVLLQREIPGHSICEDTICILNSFAFPMDRTVISRQSTKNGAAHITLYAFQNPQQILLSMDDFGGAQQFEKPTEGKVFTFIAVDETKGTIYAIPIQEGNRATPTRLTLDHDGLWTYAKE